jgi:hypothetical protein
MKCQTEKNAVDDPSSTIANSHQLPVITAPITFGLDASGGFKVQKTINKIVRGQEIVRQPPTLLPMVAACLAAPEMILAEWMTTSH